MTQNKEKEWHEQWTLYQDDERFLFTSWIYPHALESFRQKDILECGCGGGQHTSFMAPYAKSVTAVDLNTIDIARKGNQQFKNVFFVEADIAEMDLGRLYDVVISIGVVHHTDSPDATIENLKRHVKPGGRLIVWVYSKEGNALVAHGVEPLRKLFLRRIARSTLSVLSTIVTVLMYIPIYTLYKLPLKQLPYYEYFDNFRDLSFYRNTLNVFDKLNAPQVEFISHERAKRWFPDDEFDEVTIRAYKGVSWHCSGVKKRAAVHTSGKGATR